MTIIGRIVLVLVLIVGIGILWGWHVWKNRQMRKAGRVLADERTQIIEGRSARIALYLSLYFMLGLLWYMFLARNLAPGLPVPETEAALILTVLFSSVTHLAVRTYLSRKPDPA
ncbi:MAG: tetratricopeptide repeat protein [Methanomicrobiales archaeon]|nr:tetratricopeptide repeat protein [Methanomicrobiales archaeon]